MFVCSWAQHFIRHFMVSVQYKFQIHITQALNFIVAGNCAQQLMCCSAAGLAHMVAPWTGTKLVAGLMIRDMCGKGACDAGRLLAGVEISNGDVVSCTSSPVHISFAVSKVLWRFLQSSHTWQWMLACTILNL